MQTRGSKFVRFQELKLQERAIEVPLLASFSRGMRNIPAGYFQTSGMCSAFVGA